MTPSAAVIIPAAGSGTRMKLDHPKQFHAILGSPILVHTVRPFLKNSNIDKIIVVVPADWVEKTVQILSDSGLSHPSITVTAGGIRRQDSVLAGLQLLDETTDIVLVHDGARPLVSQDLIDRCCRAAHLRGAAIAAVPVKDTLKRQTPEQLVADTVDRDGLWQAQTPQAARLSLLLDAYHKVGDQDVTDESSLLEKAGVPVTLVEGSETNIKITRPEDLELAEKIMQPHVQAQIRIGHGFDAHRLVDGRKLVLGGVTIPFHQGLAGHSDADVLTHALCDAILGALGAGDIGSHFPDSDAKFKNIYSITLLEEVMQLARQRNYTIANIDITVVCQAPKLAPHLPAMKKIVADACGITEDAVNLKATTTEKMGYTGRGEGISCHAVVLLQQTLTSK
jgi:2-C-methyl-D-erythritol 4-phosphate cytidylyltransferase/2-C-methyl-D-erythritol 2,4-cyclodiphosphate synthase